MGFSLNELNLSSVDLRTSKMILPKGRYLATAKKAELVDGKQPGSKQIKIEFEDTKTGGVITAWLNVYLPHSTEGTRIGREELKSFLFCSGHPTPDTPGDINTFSGRTVGIVVKEDEYMGKKNTKVSGFFDPAEMDSSRTPRARPVKSATPSGIPGGLVGDDIPF